jgi:predicted outer membrane repeat protein
MRDRSSIHHASATGGGVINGDDGVSITLRDDASLHHNTAGGYGAAINSGGTIVLRDRASVHDNAIDGPGDPAQAAFGSAIDIWRYGTDPTTLTIRDAATVRANTALSGGAGIFVWTACGDGNDPVVRGAKRTRVFGNTPKNLVRYDDTAGC